jgi:hypothetical protein
MMATLPAELVLELVHAHADDARTRLALRQVVPSLPRAGALRSRAAIRRAQRAFDAWRRNAAPRRYRNSWRRRRVRTDDTPVLSAGWGVPML